MALVVVATKNILFGQKITVRANYYVCSRFGSFLGNRRFFLDERRILTLKMKTKHLQVGDRITMDQLVLGARDWTKVPWEWA